MKYINAETILPQELLDKVREYIEEGLLYIPRQENERRPWGEKSGRRLELASRNEAIRRCFREDSSIMDLSQTFFLSVETIKKIVYSK